MKLRRLLQIGVTLFFFCTQAIVFCQTAEKKPTFYWPLQLGNESFAFIEVASTPEECERGLMKRTSLPEGGGMLFLFSKEEERTFWMRNTLIPLDIIFLNHAGVITAIHTMQTEPPQKSDESVEHYLQRLPLYESKAPASAAIEINGGMAAVLGLQPGKRIEINRKELKGKLKK